MGKAANREEDDQPTPLSKRKSTQNLLHVMSMASGSFLVHFPYAAYD
jgi:hypothetical protein